MTVTDVGIGDASGERAADAPPPSEPRPLTGRPGRGPWILMAAIGLTVALVVAGGIGFLVYGSTYQPLRWGDTTRIVTPSLKPIGDGLTATNLILVGPKGTSGTVQYALANTGTHPVRILPESNAYDTIPVVKLAWEAETMDGVTSGGRIDQERQFPATIPAHSEIALWITIIQPACGPNSGSGINDQLDVRWSALGWHHNTWLQLGTAPGEFLPLVTCPLKTTFSHLESGF